MMKRGHNSLYRDIMSVDARNEVLRCRRIANDIPFSVADLDHVTYGL